MSEPNFIERIVIRKEVDMTLNALKKYWPTVLHVLVAVVLAVGPQVDTALASHKSQAWAGIGLVVWAEVMHWARSPKNQQ